MPLRSSPPHPPSVNMYSCCPSRTVNVRSPAFSPTTNSNPSSVGSMVMNEMLPSSFFRDATALFHSPKSNTVCSFALRTSISPRSLDTYFFASFVTRSGAAGTTRRFRDKMDLFLGAVKMKRAAAADAVSLRINRFVATRSAVVSKSQMTKEHATPNLFRVC